MGGGSNIGKYEHPVGWSSVLGLRRNATSGHGPRFDEVISGRLRTVSKHGHPPHHAQALPAGAAPKHSRAVDSRCVSALLVERQDDVKDKTTATSRTGPDWPAQQHILERKPRRMTIYIPSDDTTIQTIHPRMISCGNRALGNHESVDGILPVVGLRNYQSEYVNGKVKGSAGRIAARRVPLQIMTTSHQETAYIPDQVEKEGGKENISQQDCNVHSACLSIKLSSALVTITHQR